MIVEDDKKLAPRLAKAMVTRGFEVSIAGSVADALSHIYQAAPAFAVIDVRLGDGNGLDIISTLRKVRPDSRAIILTGYGSIASAVNAVKLGAIDYLSKPAEADQIVAALFGQNLCKADPPKNSMSASRVRWEHIQR